jgi:hypothetical protein
MEGRMGIADFIQLRRFGFRLVMRAAAKSVVAPSMFGVMLRAWIGSNWLH